MMRGTKRAQKEGGTTKADASRYGDLVKKRRTEKVTSVMAEKQELSKSQARKLVKSQEKAARNPTWDFERQSGRLYEELLRSIRQGKEESCAKARNLLALFFENAESPIVSVEAAWQKEKNGVKTKAAYVQQLSHQHVSRGLQVCWKVGDEAIKKTILEKVEEVFADLASTPCGHHLCIKMLKFISSNKAEKQTAERLRTRVFEQYKSFWTKYGSRVWDEIAAELSLNKLVHIVFYQRLFESEFKSEKFLNEAPVTTYKECSAPLQKTVRERVKEFADRLIVKELLDSEIAQRFLRTAIEICCCDEERTEDLKVICETLHEATRVLLKYKDGVYCVCAMVGLWTARQRREFLDESDRVMKLDNVTWLTFLENPVDNVFVGRFLSVMDDTKRSTQQILAPIMGVTMKNDKVVVSEEAEQIWSERLLNPSTARQTLGMLGASIAPSQASKFVTSFRLDQLLMPSPTSKKEAAVRGRELATFWHTALAALRKALPELDTWVEAVKLPPILNKVLFGDAPEPVEATEEAEEAASAETRSTEADSDGDEAAADSDGDEAAADSDGDEAAADSDGDEADSDAGSEDSDLLEESAEESAEESE